jgi:rhodanese-related sulfurtransferase
MTVNEAELSPERVAELQADDRWQIVDVREDAERAAGSIAGSRHVELARLTAEADSIDRDRPVVFYCRVGARSAMAAQAFRASGWDAYTMGGGLLRWEAQGLPLDPPGGRVADH